jgi:methionine synthase II (cobalamin-independent)
MARAQIDKDTTIEDLITLIPKSVTYLREKGIRCIMCGEPVWGTLETAAKEKGFGDEDIAKFVREINELED